MTISERTDRLSSGFQDGINCISQLRELRVDPPFVSAAELEEWRETLDRTQSTFTEIQLEIQAEKAWTSLRLTSDLVRSVEDIRTHLSGIAPGSQLPATLFALVEVAWSEFAKAMSR